MGSSPLGAARHPSIAVDRIRIAEVSYWRTPISPGTILDLRQIRHVTHPQLIRNSIRTIGSSYLCRVEAEVRFVLRSGETERPVSAVLCLREQGIAIIQRQFGGLRMD